MSYSSSYHREVQEILEFGIYAYIQNEIPTFIYRHHRLSHHCLVLASEREETLGHVRGFM